MAEVHKHILVTGYTQNAPQKDYIMFLEKWFEELVDDVKMNILIPPKCVWCDTDGNEGITGLVCIDTSHSSIHFWSLPKPYFKFDLYSCKDFSTNVVVNMLKKLNLGLTSIAYTTIDRSDDSHPIVSSGIINF